MWFNSKKQPVLTLTPDKLVAEDVAHAKNGQYQRQEYVWDDTTLVSVVVEALNALKTQSVRLLLDDQFVYVLTLRVSPTEAERTFLQTKIAAMVPEDVSTVYWDFQQKLEFEDGDVLVQVFVLTQRAQELLQEISQNIELTIEAIWPYSVALAEAAGDSFESYVLGYADSAIQLTAVVYHQTVLVTQAGLKLDPEKDIPLLQQKAQKLVSVNPTTLIVSGFKVPDVSVYDQKLKLFQQELFPAAELAQTNQIAGRDRDILNLALSSTGLELGDQSSQWLADITGQSRKWQLIGVGLLAITLALATGIGLSLFVLGSGSI